VGVAEKALTGRFEGLGKHRGATGLEPQDFAALKAKLARRNAPHRMCAAIQVIRCACKHAYESGALDRPMRFGPSFKRTARKLLRLHRAKQGAKLFTAAEVRMRHFSGKRRFCPN
jgi:hypothetical protein